MFDSDLIRVVGMCCSGGESTVDPGECSGVLSSEIDTRCRQELAVGGMKDNDR